MKLTIHYPDGLKDIFEGVDQDVIDHGLATKILYLDREDFEIYIPLTAIRTIEIEDDHS